MTFYLLCYELNQPPDEQRLQISLWLRYLNSNLPPKITHSHSPSCKVFVIGLKSDLKCSEPLLYESAWNRRFPNLIIHPATFEVGSHTNLTSLISLAESLDEQFDILFNSHALQVPKEYTEDYKEQSVFPFDHVAHYQHSTGKIVVVNHQAYVPAEISAILTNFISPPSIRTKLLYRAYGSSISLLTEEEVAVILECGDTSNEYAQCICYNINTSVVVYKNIWI